MPFRKKPASDAAAQDRLRRSLFAALTVLTSALFTLRFALARGQDFNWDRRNYHLGTPFLLAQGHFWDSIAPAGIQSYFNPLLLQIQFWGMQHLGAKSFAILLGLIQSSAFMLAGLVCAMLVRPGESWKAFLLALLGLLLCLFAPMALSEAGTSYIDLLTAIPVLAAYASLLKNGGPRNALLAGALLGLATALKLTNAIFVIGAIGFAFAGPARPRIASVLACWGGAMAAFAVTGGPWMLTLWRRFGNPFFPYYNNIFRSPDFLPEALHDERFLPHSLLDIWRYPLFWLRGGSPVAGIFSPSSELAFRDARWVLVIGGGTVLLAALLAFRRWGRAQLAAPGTGLFFAFMIDYLLWLGLFGIHRYLLPLEILCGALLLFYATLLQPYCLRLGLMLAAVIVTARAMSVPDWGHMPWRADWEIAGTPPQASAEPTLIFLTGKPMSFVTLKLAANARYVGISGELDLRAGNDTSLTRQLKQALAAQPHLQEVDTGSVPGAAVAILASYGLAAGDHCQPLMVAYETFRLCDVTRRP